MKFEEKAKIISQTKIGEGIFDMWLDTCNIAEKSVPGQFISVYTKDASRLLPRPISICETSGSGLRIVYRVAGDGTREFSTYRAGDDVRIIGPMGNGFPLKNDTDAILIGGGIGIPPMLELARRLDCSKEIVLGYRDGNTFLEDELKAFGNVTVATDDGSKGIHGTVIDAMEQAHISGKVIYACGPTPMLRGIKAYAMEKGIEAYVSLEEKMACGIGACLACVCRTTGIDGHSGVNNARVCKDGPVFNVKEVEL